MNQRNASSQSHGGDLAREQDAKPQLSDDVVERVSALIDSARESIASYANAALTLTYWQIGSLIDSEVLGEERAEYGAQILVTLSQELMARFGWGL